MITIIVGKRSNLSENLSNKMKDSKVISSKEVLEDALNITERHNIIINSFQPATHLNNLENPVEYIENSILITSKILSKINKKCVNKIIYTSSSSVYGDNIYCKEIDNLIPMNLHASLKIANEKLIEKFCEDNNIKFTIARIFNMYGGNDNFSIISKIITAYINKTAINIVNNGHGIRDFIHIDDVSNVYKKLLTIDDKKILNVASGVGYSLREILDYINFKGYKIETSNINKNEIKISTASIEKLSNIIDTSKFINVKDFVIEQMYNWTIHNSMKIYF